MIDMTKLPFELLKLAPRYLIAIGLVAGLMLFGGESFRDTLGLSKFVSEYRPYLGGLFLTSFVLLLVAISHDGVSAIMRRRREKEHDDRVRQYLRGLNEGEKQILRYYFTKNTRANSLRIDDGVVQGLVSNGIIFQSSALGTYFHGFAHNICDVAWDYLNAHPELLVGSTNTYRTDKTDDHW